MVSYVNQPGSTAPGGGAPEAAVAYVHTTNLPQLFHESRLSLFVTTYQAQRVLCFSSPDGQRMSMLMRVLPRPTGLALTPNRMAVCTREQIWIFGAVAELHDLEGKRMPYDWCYVPRRSHVTGDVMAHQILWSNDELLIVNTRFSCLASLADDCSFVPGWRPPFISACLPEDRCHLNGVCLKDGKPRYATALGATDTKEGWRANKAKGGVLIDILSGEVITRGLSMPHTPLFHGGRLWMLESGTGSLLVVDEKSGKTQTAARLPGFLRGLAFAGQHAFIGVCKIRDKATFGALPISAAGAELKCGICILDVTSGKTLGFIEFTKGIEELFDLQLLQGPQNPHVVGFEEPTVGGIFVLPPEAQRK